MGTEKPRWTGHWYKIIDTPITDDEGKPLKLALIEDISSYKETEEKLFHEQERYRNIVDDQSELICRFSTGMTITFANSAYCSYFEKTLDELTNSSFIPLIPEEDMHLVRDCVEGLSFDSPVGTVEHRVIMPDGSIRWQHWTNRAIFNTEREIIEYQAVGRDITERKEREDRDKRNRIQLESQIEEKTAGLSQVIEWLNENIRQKEEITGRFQLLCHALNSIKSITIIADSSGNVELVNDMLTAKTGFSREDVLRNSLRNFTGYNIDEIKSIRDTVLAGSQWKGPCFFPQEGRPRFQ